MISAIAPRYSSKGIRRPTLRRASDGRQPHLRRSLETRPPLVDQIEADVGRPIVVAAPEPLPAVPS